MQLDDPICYCFHVSKRKIVSYLRVHHPRVASELSQCGGAGTGCGWCVPYLKKYFAEYAAEGRVSADDLSRDEYAKQRAGYIREGKGTPAAGAIPLPDEQAE
jgi:bacterioferritin-associated ferredoxin